MTVLEIDQWRSGSLRLSISRNAPLVFPLHIKPTIITLVLISMALLLCFLFGFQILLAKGLPVPHHCYDFTSSTVNDDCGSTPLTRKGKKPKFSGSRKHSYLRYVWLPFQEQLSIPWPTPFWIGRDAHHRYLATRGT